MEETKKNYQLVTAKEGFESTKAPQLERVIREINESRERGHTYTYVANEEKLHQETIDFLLDKGYDLEISHHKDSMLGREKWFNEVHWNSEASGRFQYIER